MRWFFVLMMAAAAGCARYEFDLVEPAELARHVGKTQERVSLEPLTYRLEAYENRLVMRIENPTEEAIEVLGEQSVVVSPDRQSHPIRSQSIAPGSFVKLILPPIPPRVDRFGPSLGLGLGVRASRGGVHKPVGRGLADPVAAPRYFSINEDDAYYWEWAGETTVRMTLVYRRGREEFRQGFVWVRRKM
jgi:hypothetical protein